MQPHVFVETHSVDAGGIATGGEVLELDPVTLMTTPLRTHATAARVSSAAGSLLIVDDSEVWRYQPGQPLERIAADRERPDMATSDGSHVYWTEGPQDGRVLVRRAIGGSSAEPVGGLGPVVALAVDDDDVYVARLDGATVRIPSDGDGTSQAYPGSPYPAVQLVVEDGLLYRLDRAATMDRIDVVTGVATSMASHISADTHGGFALSITDAYVTSDLGIERVPRGGTDRNFELFRSGAATATPALLVDVLYWTDGEKVHRCDTR